ncbi:methyltransferase [Bacillus shivajii]|uniref:class I SAM-dependent methyltransferase n=1 Tax=Bacillus shivajii TaxID=1983719 RepID=UPI001CF9B1BF|nr:methyltransferase [Bacillus shivajii]UCZ53360.1 methyltransferase [Bacillus shivajii]
MSNHYYSEKPEVESQRKKITETINEVTFQYIVDRGIFSKKGIDFGSKLLIETFEETLDVAGPIADVGCGWGPIGIAIAKRYENRKVHMFDINERAISLSIENAKVNGVGNVVVEQNNLLENQPDEFYSAIVSNPPIRAGKEVIFKLYEQAVEALKLNGELWLVIQKKQGAPSTMKKLEELGLDVEIVNKSKGFFIIRGKKIDSTN